MRPRRWSAALLAGILVAVGIVGCGRTGEGDGQDYSKLEITRYRFVIDDEHDKARIIAEITNRGDTPIDEATVTAILRGAGGQPRGENRVVVRDLPPHQSKVFSIAITTHGREKDVDFRITGPERRR